MVLFVAPDATTVVPSIVPAADIVTEDAPLFLSVRVAVVPMR